MLSGQAVRFHEGLDAANQSWFRPDNRFPKRVFGSIVDSLGDECSSVIPHHLLEIPVEKAARLESEIKVSEQLEPEEGGVYALAERARGASGPRPKNSTMKTCCSNL